MWDSIICKSGWEITNQRIIVNAASKICQNELGIVYQRVSGQDLPKNWIFACNVSTNRTVSTDRNFYKNKEVNPLEYQVLTSDFYDTATLVCGWPVTGYEFVRPPGLEPGTRWLRVSCSTNWAMGAMNDLPKKVMTQKRRFTCPGVVVAWEQFVAPDAEAQRGVYLSDFRPAE